MLRLQDKPLRTGALKPVEFARLDQLDDANDCGFRVLSWHEIKVAVVEGLEPGIEPNLSRSILHAGQDPARVIATARSPAISAAYDAATDEARKLNIFGAPTLVVRGEVFWGDDRVEDAIAWLRQGELR